MKRILCVLPIVLMLMGACGRLQPTVPKPTQLTPPTAGETSTSLEALSQAAYGAARGRAARAVTIPPHGWKTEVFCPPWRGKNNLACTYLRIYWNDAPPGLDDGPSRCVYESDPVQPVCPTAPPGFVPCPCAAPLKEKDGVLWAASANAIEYYTPQAPWGTCGCHFDYPAGYYQ